MNPVIRIGHIDLSFHAASAAVVQALFEDHGYRTELSAAPHEQAFERYGRDQIDVLVSAWLPASHQRYLAPHAHRTEHLGVLYEPYCIWGVPDYVPAEIDSVADLLQPLALERVQRRIQGINPGAGISRFSQAMVREYGLDQAGYHWEAGNEAECFDGFEQAVAERRWLVIPLWHPQYLHHRHRIRALHEPRGLLGGTDQATLIAHTACVAQLDAALVERLRRLHLGNEVVTALDYRIRVEGVEPRVAAREWLQL